jgi:hypothetical protein
MVTAMGLFCPNRARTTGSIFGAAEISTAPGLRGLDGEAMFWADTATVRRRKRYKTTCRFFVIMVLHLLMEIAVRQHGHSPGINVLERDVMRKYAMGTCG